LEFHATLGNILRLSLLDEPLETILGTALEEVLALPWLSLQGKGAIFLVDKKDVLSLKIHRGLPPELLSACARVPFGRGLCGRAAQSGKTIQGAGPPCENGHAGLQSCGHHIAPIRASGKTLGVFMLSLTASRALAPHEETLLLSVADVLAGIIHRKRAEADLRRSDAMLRQAQKMDAIGRLASGIAHDFNNFICLILGHSALLCDSLRDGEQRESAETIHRAAKSAASLTGNLLAFGRESPQAPRRLDLNEAAAGAIGLLKHSLGKDVCISLHFAPDPMQVVFDPVQFEQVIINLAVNARDAMPQGGTLSFRTRPALIDEDDAREYAVKPGGYVLLEIADTGEGMSEEVKARLFEPFFTTKPPGKGTGLGLATVYGIVKQNGGGIVVKSVLGHGTCFRICLPVTG